MYRLLELNPQTKDFAIEVNSRIHSHLGSKRNEITNAQEYFGIHRVKGGWIYREWAPEAQQLYLTGDFNRWNWTEQPMMRYGNGCWMLFLPGDDTLWEGCRVQTIVDMNGNRTAHVPLFSFRVVQAPDDDSLCAEIVGNSESVFPAEQNA